MRDDKLIQDEFGIDLSGHERRLVHQGTETGRWSGVTPRISEVDRMITASQKLKDADWIVVDNAEITDLKFNWFMYGFAAALVQSLVAFIAYVEYLK